MKLQGYNPEWAFRSALRAQAVRWQRQQLLSPAQLSGIEAAYPLDYYRPEWPLRVGLFLFTTLGLGMLSGLVLLVTDSSVLPAVLLTCVGCFIALEKVIQKRRFYHAGADNALLYVGLGTAIWVIFHLCSIYLWPENLFDDSIPDARYLAPVLVLVLALLVAAALRYADALVTTAAFVTTLLLVVLVSLQAAWGKTLLPFLVMGTAAGTLALHRALAHRVASTPVADYYATCLVILKVLGLVMLYLGGNYLVVREGNAALHDLSDSVQVPFRLIFYALTAGLPLLYLALGLRRADRPTLVVGLSALAFSLYTLRYYRSLLPPEVAAVVVGTVLTVVAGFLLRFLRPARFGLTSEPDDEPRHFDLENLIQAQTAYMPAAPAGGFEFGGGESGGGGATGKF